MSKLLDLSFFQAFHENIIFVDNHSKVSIYTIYSEIISNVQSISYQYLNNNMSSVKVQIFSGSLPSHKQNCFVAKLNITIMHNSKQVDFTVA